VVHLTRPTRRKFLRAVFATLVAGVAADSCLIEPFEVTVEQVKLVVPRLPQALQGLRIVHLSDFHYGPFTGEREIRKAVEHANALHPDIAVATGDFVTAPLHSQTVNRQMVNAEACARLLSELHAPLGVFACLGNHDLSVDAYGITQILKARGINVVRNNALAIERDGGRMWVAGVDDVLYGRADLDRTLARTPRSEFTVLLAHEPDFADHGKSYPIDVQLSGHSHGGQISLPLVGAPYYPPMSRKYPCGLYRVGNLHLYTNRGIGTIFVPARFFAPPEVTLLTLFSHPDARPSGSLVRSAGTLT